MHDPRAEYATREARHRATAAVAAQAAARWSNGRLLVFLLWIGVLVLVGRDTLHPLWLLAPLPLFIWMITRHARADHAHWEGEARADLYARGVKRIDGAWQGQGDAGEDLRPDHHVYAEDLDLFGTASLFDRISEARTPPGRRRLARWWLEPADAEQIRARQGAVQELTGALDLREDLQTVGREVASALGRARAVPWAQAPEVLGPSIVPHILRVTGPLAFLSVLGWFLYDLTLWVPVGLLVLQGLCCLRGRSQVGEVLDAAEEPVAELSLISRMLARLEAEAFTAPALVEIQRSISGQGERPSRVLDRFLRMGSFIEARDNHLYHPVSWVLGLSTQIAYGIERWRAAHGQELETWLEALGRYEAYASLATYAYEDPSLVYPEIVDGDLSYEAEGVGHPLLDDAACVRNDLVLRAPAQGDRSQALVVSGSNMSGKSTLLRAVGLSVVLANAGAPVRATSLRLTPLTVAASIRVLDSLQEGASRFYAEIARLRAVVDVAREAHNCLFLLDEILHGTNSKDRRIGATAVLDTLLELGSIGMVTTHDLALTQVAEDRPPVENVHFQDELIDGKMVFDYRMKPGVVTKSNALALMRSVGLAVDASEEAPLD